MLEHGADVKENQLSSSCFSLPLVPQQNSMCKSETLGAEDLGRYEKL
jgi:hypothetical protein